MASSVRTCIGCRRKVEAGQLVRLVLAADGTLRVGPRRGAFPGRGASLHPAEACVRAAMVADAFVRAFRGRRPLSAGRPSSVADVLRSMDVATPSPVSLSPQR